MLLRHFDQVVFEDQIMSLGAFGGIVAFLKTSVILKTNKIFPIHMMSIVVVSSGIAVNLLLTHLGGANFER